MASNLTRNGAALVKTRWWAEIKLSRFTVNLIVFLTLSSIFVLLTSWSWRKWPDILVDFGHELYIPWQITQGKVLYKDMMFTMGPFSQFFNALMFSLFGVSLNTLVFCNLFILAGITFLLYQIFVRLSNRGDALIVCLVFMVVFGFSQYTTVGNYNYVCPYRHEMTHGIFFLLFTLLGIIKYIETKNMKFIFWSGISAGFSLLTKSEIFLAMIGIIATGSIILSRHHSKNLARLRILCLVFTLTFFIPPLIFLILLSSQMSFQEALNGILSNLNHSLNSNLTLRYNFYKVNLGLNDIPGNIEKLWKSILVVVAPLLMMSVIDVMLIKTFKIKGVLLFLIVAFSLLVLLFLPNYTTWKLVSRSLPVVVSVSLVYYLFESIKSRSNSVMYHKAVIMTLWSSMALLLLPKMFLKARLSHYGFVLAMPAMLALIIICLTIIPNYLKHRYGSGHILKAGVIGLLSCLCITHLKAANFYYSKKNLLVGNGRDRFVTYEPSVNARSFLLVEAIKTLRHVMPEEATLMVLPEGITLNYLLRKTNPTPYYLLTPWEMEAFGGEDAVLANIAAHPPDFIAVLHINMKEHGKTFFGALDYGGKIMNWIHNHYLRMNQLKMVPYNENRFRIDLYRQNTGVHTEL